MTILLQAIRCKQLEGEVRNLFVNSFILDLSCSEDDIVDSLVLVVDIDVVSVHRVETGLRTLDFFLTSILDESRISRLRLGAVRIKWRTDRVIVCIHERTFVKVEQIISPSVDILDDDRVLHIQLFEDKIHSFAEQSDHQVLGFEVSLLSMVGDCKDLNSVLSGESEGKH